MFIAYNGYICRENSKICVHFLHWDILLIWQICVNDPNHRTREKCPPSLKVESKTGIEECWGINQSEGRNYDSRTLKLTMVNHSCFIKFWKLIFFLFLFCISLCKVLSSYEIKFIVQEIHPRFACYLHSLPGTEDTRQHCGTSVSGTVVFISSGLGRIDL